LRALGNRALGGFVNLVYRAHYTDLCYGFNVFWRRHVPVLGLDATSPAPPGDGRLWGDGFEVETLIHLRVADAGLTVVEVPSFEYSRIHGVSNLNAFSDGLRVLRTILAERCRSILAASRQDRASAPMPSVDHSMLDDGDTWPMPSVRAAASASHGRARGSWLKGMAR
jgi:hypothetical protein